MSHAKVYVTVAAEHYPDGTARPLAIVWEDGRRYAVDRILEVKRAASLKAGGCGMRYTCRICGREVSLFDEDGRWFMERRDGDGS